MSKQDLTSTDSGGLAEPGQSPIPGSRRVVTTTAPESAADANEHLNVRYHFDLLCEAIQRDLERCGFDEEYRRTRRNGIFTVEHACRYLSEILVGDTVTAWVRLESVSGKTLTYSSALQNESRGRIASTMRAVLVNVDLTTRRSTEFAAASIEELRSR